MPKILNDTRFDLAVLAREAGVSHGYLRLVATGKRNPGKALRAKLAAALRERGRKMSDLADLLESDGSADELERGADRGP